MVEFFKLLIFQESISPSEYTYKHTMGYSQGEILYTRVSQ